MEKRLICLYVMLSFLRHCNVVYSFSLFQLNQHQVKVYSNFITETDKVIYIYGQKAGTAHSIQAPEEKHEISRASNLQASAFEALPIRLGANIILITIN